MALLIFNPAPAKGATAEATLDKSELLEIAAEDEFFSQETNLTRIVVFYKSTLGKQKKRMEFFFSDESPKSTISFHARARSSFFLQKIVLLNHAGDKITLDRAKIPNALMYDIVLG